MLKKLLIAASLVVALPATATVETWDFADNNQGGSFSNQSSITVDSNLNDDSLAITGWSDSAEDAGTIEQGALGYSNSTYPLTMVNASGADDSASWTDPVDHSIDNNEFFDMVLLAFDTAINLESFTVGWTSEQVTTSYAYKKTSSSGKYCQYVGLSGWKKCTGTDDYTQDSTKSQADVTVAALGNDFDASDLVGNTWGTVVNDFSYFSQSYSDVAKNTTTDISADTSGIFSKYWLVGAYNPIFGQAEVGDFEVHDDGIKLAAVSGWAKAPGTDVPEPAPLVLLSLAIMGLFASRKRS